SEVFTRRQTSEVSKPTSEVLVAEIRFVTSLELQKLLEAVKAGVLDVETAAAQLAAPAVGDLGFATLDLHRRERCGFPEVIFGEGKTAEWLIATVERLALANQDCLATR